jgi:hypothetical protein
VPVERIRRLCSADRIATSVSRGVSEAKPSHRNYPRNTLEDPNAFTRSQAIVRETLDDNSAPHTVE